MSNQVLPFSTSQRHGNEKYRDWYIITVLGIYITRTIDDAEDEFQGHTEQNGSTYEGLIVFTI